MYVMFGSGVMPGSSSGTRGRRRSFTRRPRVRESEDARHVGSSSGAAHGGTVQKVQLDDNDDDDFMPRPPPRRQLSPENPDDYKRDPSFEPLPPITYPSPFRPPLGPYYRFL